MKYSQSSPPQSQTVRFSPKVRVRRHLQISDMTNDEIEATYYQQHEYDQIHNDVIHHMDRKEKQGDFEQSEDDILEFRGIDTWAEREAKVLRRQQAVDVVLSVQHDYFIQRTSRILASIVDNGRINTRLDPIDDDMDMTDEDDDAVDSVVISNIISAAYRKAGTTQCQSIANLVALRDEREASVHQHEWHFQQ